MRLNHTEFDGAISNIGVRKDFGFAANGKAFRTLFDTLYQDKIGSIVREVSCNAFDAHVFAGKGDLPFEIHLPSMMEPYFSVKDYGIGMDEETIGAVFTIMFASTKDNSNIGVGGFGLGSKTPFAYTDNFTVISIKDGISTTYTMFLSQDGTPGYVKLSEKQTTECNGVEIMLPVNDVSDRKAFSNAIINQLHFFPVRPVIKGGDYGLVWKTEPADSDATMIHNNVKFFSRHSLKSTDRPGNFIVVGPVGYELNYRLLNEKLPKHTKLINWMQEQSVRVCFNIGEVSVTPSRETLSYDDMTIQAFDKKLDGLLDILTKQYCDEFNAIGSLLEKAIFMANNNTWARKLVDKSLYSVFDKSILTTNYSGNYNNISATKIAEMVKQNSYAFIRFRPLGTFGQKRNYNFSDILQFNKPEFNFCIIDTSRFLDRRLTTAATEITLTDYYALVINRESLDDNQYKDVIKEIKDLLCSYGFTVRQLSEFAPAKVERDYSAVKSHGYRIRAGIDFKREIETSLPSSYAWEKLLNKSEITPGFYIESHYGKIEQSRVANIKKLLQLKAFKMLPEEMNLDIFALPLKACEKLSEDDGWVKLDDYISKVADVNISELCHDVWVADSLEKVIKELDAASIYTLQVLSNMLPIHNMFNSLRALLIDNQIMLGGCDAETLEVMISLKPISYIHAANRIKNSINRFIVKKFKAFPLLPIDQIFSYAYENLKPDIVKEYVEYVEFFSNKYPERLNTDEFDLSLLEAEFPAKPGSVVAPVVTVPVVESVEEEIEDEENV